MPKAAGNEPHRREEWRIFCGSIVHSVGDQRMLRLPNKILGIYGGKVSFLEDSVQLEELKSKHGFCSEDIYTLKDGEFLMPGLVDTHLHAPQYANVGLGTGKPLLQWLTEMTYPTEQKFRDVNLARKVYSNVVRRTLANGTTTACYFATIHLEATICLCDIIEEQGQRAFVGKVNADCYPDGWLCESAEQSLATTVEFVENVRNRNNPLIAPILTPRFALACTENLMTSLGELAHRHDLPIQSHIGENETEIQEVAIQFPQCKSYAEVYDRHGLLTKKTVMAHGIYLTPACIQLFKEREVGVAHCPNSNATLLSGTCDVRHLLANGIKVGLATDISGGYSVSMLDAMRRAIDASSMLSHSKPRDYKALNYEDVFYLATRGGSEVLGIDDKIGNFEVGKDFDALLVDVSATGGPIDVMETDTLAEKVERFIFLGDDRNIKRVFVSGHEIKF